PCTHVILYFFFQAEDGIRDRNVTGVQTCALPISLRAVANPPGPGSAEPWVPWPAGVTPRAWPTAWSGRASKTKDWRSTSTTRRDEAPQRPNPGRAQGSAPCPASQGRLQPFGGVGIAQPQFVEEQRDECGQGSQDLVGGQVVYQAWFQGRCHIRGEQVGTFGVVGGQVQTKTGQGDLLRKGTQTQHQIQVGPGVRVPVGQGAGECGPGDVGVGLGPEGQPGTYSAEYLGAHVKSPVASCVP